MSWNLFYGLSAALMGASTIVVVQPQIATAQVEEQAIAQGASAKPIANLAREATVVINGQNPGSGVIVARQGNTYYVLTAKHVVATQDEYEIVTSDATQHLLDYSTVKKLPGVDLAVVQFKSDKNYRVALLGDSETASEGATVYISGWPHPGRAITQRIYQMTQGSISGRPLKPLEDGYALVYTNITRSGMSGGPVLDAQGRVIGIHGRAEGESIYNPDTGDSVNVKSGFNLGIPINSFLNLASQAGVNLSFLRDDFSVAKVFSAHSETVSSVAISPNGKTLASSSSDNTIKLWDINTGKELRTLAGHSQSVLSVAFSPDGQIVASGSNDGSVKVWNTSTGKLLHTLTDNQSSIRAVAISPNGTQIASADARGNDESTIKIWNLQTGELRSTLKGHFIDISCVAFSPDGQTLVSGSSDHTIRIWNLNTGLLLKTLGHSTGITSVVFSPDGQLLVSAASIYNFYRYDPMGNEDSAILIWKASTGELLHTLKGHSGLANSIAQGAYGQILASGGYDGTIKLWNLHTGQLLRTLEVRDSKGQFVKVDSVAVSADGQTLVSGGDDGTVRIWQLAKR